MPTDDAEARDLFVATVAAAQCLRLCLTLDHIRDFLERGSAGESEGRSASDLASARQYVEPRIIRISSIASALSTIGLDAEIGDLATSKLIRNFWGDWTPRELAELERCLKSPGLASFKSALTRLRPLIKSHDLLHRYLIDIRNRRTHDPEIDEFLRRHLDPVDDNAVALMTLHDQGHYITLAGVAHVLDKSQGHARRKLRDIGLQDVGSTTSRGAKLYDIKLLVTQCRDAGVSLRDPVAGSSSKNSQYFCSSNPLPGASAPRAT